MPSQDAKALIARILHQFEGDGTSPLLHELNAADFLRTPPTMKEFIEDDYYLGVACRSDPDNGQDGLYPKWREMLLRDFGPDSQVQQLVLTGAIGLGKSFMASVVLLYRLAYALCLRNPVQYFGLSAASAITYSFFSVTQEQVKDGTFADAIRFMRLSPFFRERSITRLDQKFSGMRVDIAGNLAIEAGSKIHEALGRNVLVSCVDEVNFRLEKDAAKAAHELVEAIQRRITSRFKRDKGEVTGASHPGLLILMSSAKSEDDFLVEYVRKYRNDPKVRVYDFAWWEVVGPVKMSYCGKTFTVDIGDAIVPPRIIDDPTLALDVPPSRLLFPPVEHRPEFERDLPGSIRDLAGISTGRVSKLFASTLPILNSISDELADPMRTDSIPLSVRSTSSQISDFVNLERLLQRRSSRIVPRRHPDAGRFIHLDMASGAMDALGFAMIHPTGNAETDVIDRLTHRVVKSMRPVFELDIAFRVIRSASGSDPIDFGRIREFIWWLKKRNFDIKMVSCDLAAMSLEMRNILESNGFKTCYTSVDRKKDQYVQLKQTFDEGRFSMFRHDYLMTELEHLEDRPDKIDHPDQFIRVIHNGVQLLNLQGSKDLADGICGAVFNASQDDSVKMDDYTLAQRSEAIRRISDPAVDAWPSEFVRKPDPVHTI